MPRHFFDAAADAAAAALPPDVFAAAMPPPPAAAMLFAAVIAAAIMIFAIIDVIVLFRCFAPRRRCRSKKKARTRTRESAPFRGAMSSAARRAMLRASAPLCLCRRYRCRERYR